MTLHGLSIGGTHRGNWAPTTQYNANDTVVAPDGTTQKAKITFTSGASFSQTNWDPVVTGSAGIELGYSEMTSSMSLSGTLADVPSLSIAITAPNRPFRLEFWGTAQLNKGTAATSASSQIVINLYDISNMATPLLALTHTLPHPSAGPLLNNIYGSKRLNLAAGTTKTFKAQAYVPTLATGATAVLLGATTYPCWIGAYAI